MIIIKIKGQYNLAQVVKSSEGEGSKVESQ